MTVFIDKHNVIFYVNSQDSLDALFYAEGMYVVAMDGIGGVR